MSKDPTDRTKANVAKDGFYDEAMASPALSSSHDSDTLPASSRAMIASLAARHLADEKPLNLIELRALCGMIAYVAHTQTCGEATVVAMLEHHFNVSTLRTLPSRCYDEAIAYLTNLKVKTAVH